MTTRTLEGIQLITTMQGSTSNPKLKMLAHFLESQARVVSILHIKVRNMEKTAASLSTIPAELRLRILGYTHLGPPDIGGYVEYRECLRIRDGKIIPRVHPLLEPLPVFHWSVSI